jgi:hypothetical protein
MTVAGASYLLESRDLDNSLADDELQTATA